MENKFIALAVGLTVGVIMLSGFLWPVIADATTTEKTFKNVGYFDLKEYSGDDIEYTAKWEYINPHQFTVNDEVIPITYTENVNTSIVLDGNFFLRYFPVTGNGGVTLYYGQQALVVASVDTTTDMTLTYADGVLTVTNGTATRDISVETFYSIANDGPFVMKKGDVSAYMNSDSIIYGSGRTNVGTDIVGTLVSGTTDDVEVTIWRGSATARDIVVNKETVSGYSDLYKFSSVEFVVDDTLEDNPTTEQTITYSYVVVPAEVTAELSQHLDTTQIALVAAIGTLGAIVLIAAAAGSIRRLD